MTAYRRMRLGDILTAKGVVSREQIDTILASSDSRQRRIGERLIDEGIATEEAVFQALAEQRGLHYANLADFHIPARFFQTISIELMQRHQFVPMEDAGDVLGQVRRHGG